MTAGRPRLRAAALAGALLALVPLLAAPRADANGPFPASVEEKMSFPGTHGFGLTLSVTDHTTFFLEAKKRVGARGKELAYYIATIRRDPGGRIDAKIGRFGRVDVDFIRDSSRALPAAGCKGAGTVERGRFVGLVTFRGGRGFSRARRRSVVGTVTRRTAGTCPDLGPSRGSLEQSRPGGASRFVYLLSGGRSSNEGLEAFRLMRGGKHPKKASYFRAYASSKEGGLDVLSSASVEVPSLAPFVVPSAATPPEEATLRPPAPFTGSATFRLLAPTHASWTGDLAAPLPGLGVVRLAHPGEYVGLCREKSCTKTLPQGKVFLEEEKKK